MDQVIRAQFIGLLWDISNQLLIQWGFCGGTTTTTYTLPTAFSNTTWKIIFSMGDENQGGNFTAAWLEAYDRTTTTFTHYRNSTLSHQDYIAVGF